VCFRYRILRPLICSAFFLGTILAAGASPKTSDDLASLIHATPDNGSLSLTGTYSAPAGTTLVVPGRIHISGNAAVLVNIRLIFLADMSLSGVSFVENDCSFHVASPDACSPSTPIITLGLQGYSINSAVLTDISMQFGRAYTGIAFGSGAIQNVTIDGFSIVDQEMSGITGLGGSHILIQNGTITGGSQANVDDAVALYSAASPLTDVTVRNVHAQDTFDLVGIGALMYYPTQGINVVNDACTRTAVCIYVKAGSQTPPPQPFQSYSSMNGLSISGIQDSDPGGARYLSSIWFVATGGASASGISIDHYTASARSAASASARIRFLTDSTSKLSSITLSDVTIADTVQNVPASATGYVVTEGVNFQDLGTNNMSGITLTSVSLDHATAYAIDSGSAIVSGLAMSNCKFTHMGAPMMHIPYGYMWNGVYLPPASATPTAETSDLR